MLRRRSPRSYHARDWTASPATPASSSPRRISPASAGTLINGGRNSTASAFSSAASIAETDPRADRRLQPPPASVGHRSRVSPARAAVGFPAGAPLRRHRLHRHERVDRSGRRRPSSSFSPNCACTRMARATPGRSRRTLGTLAAEAVGRDAGAVLNGIDVLVREDFARLRGLRVGLIADQDRRPRPRRPHHRRSALRRQGRETCRPLQPRARHPRRGR